MTLSFPGRSVPFIVATVTALAVTPPAPANAQAAPRPTSPATSTTITLITGDKVTVRPGVTTVQGPDGEPVGAHITSVGPDTYVYPDTAMPYVGTGLLDKRLFNVTRLLRDGYGDTAAGRLPVILGYQNAAAGRRADALPAASTEVRALPSIQARAVSTDRDRAEDFWASLTGAGAGARVASAAPAFAHGITKVWLDGKVHADLADSVAQIGAPSVWAGGNVGDGVDVAVLDTGVDAQHPDLVGQVESSVSFVPGEDVTDRHGHGTHVASTIAGTGAGSEGRERGVAPGADLQIGKVLDNGGAGYDSWIIAGMEWAARDRKAKVVSLSLGGSPTDGTDPMSQAVDELSAETGALFVIAAGNSGPSETTVGTPGAADAALTVGAVDSEDQIAEFSSRGPRLVDRALKPEITAPGVGIVAARSQYSSGEGLYRTMSGTSMATPHVAGAAALLAAQHSGWTGGQLKDALVSTAKETPDLGPYDGGSGRLDIAATTGATVFATATAYLGIHPRSGGTTGVTERQITYTNSAAADVTLDLALVAPGVPAGLLSLSAPRVTVPAGKTGTVTVAADVSRTPDKGLYTGRVDATGPDGRHLADTVVGVSTEDQPRHLVVKATGRGGEPMPGMIGLIREGDPAGSYYSFITGSGDLDVLVPEGTYSLWMWGEVEGTHGPNSRGVALLTEPVVTVHEDTTVELKAAATREIKAITPKPTANAEMRLDYHRVLGDNTASVTDAYVLPRWFDSMWVTPGQKARDGEMSVTARWRKTEPVLAIEHDGRSLDDLIVLPGSTLLPAGTKQLPAVFAGTGTKAEFAAVDVKGKIAVVRRADLDGQVTAAEKAGATLLLIVNDEPGRYFDGTSRTKLGVATLTKDGGDHLIEQLGRGPVGLRVTSNPKTAYLYDLVRHWPGAVPKSVTYRPAERDLARVDVDFRGTSGRENTERRYDFNPDMPTRVGSTMPVLSDRFRTDWVTVQDSVRWSSEMSDVLSIQLSGSTPYRAGGTTREQWLGAIQRPRINDAVTLPTRSGNRMRAEVPGWGDSGADHAGLAVPGQVDQNLALYQGTKVVEQTPGGYLEGVAELSPKRLPYRLVTTTERDPEVYPYSVKTRTVWDFESGAGPTARLPLIQLDYQVDTDLSHRAARSAELTITPSHLPGGPSTKAIRAATLEVSYDDGVTWVSRRMHHTRNGWTTELRAPKGAQHVTLRAGARDSHGNSVEQTITRAFGLM